MHQVGYTAWDVRISCIRSALVEELILFHMRRVIPLSQHCMFCPRRHHIPCIPPTRAPSRRYYPIIYPPESGTPHPAFVLLSSSHKNSTLSPCALVSLPRCHRSVLKLQLQKQPAGAFFLARIHFAAVGWHPLESPVVAIWFTWCRAANAEDGGGLFRRIYIRRR